MKRLLVCIATLLLFVTNHALAFDHDPWHDLLQRHVKTAEDKLSTAVDYGGMARDRAALTHYLGTLAKVDQAGFDRWPPAEQLAFLINAYNAWTVELILTRYPNLQSIKDLGQLFRSPWSQQFIPLLGETLSLDDIEHKRIRGSGRYNDPRIHFAVNCASIGCPALKTEAYRGDKIDKQLEEATTIFLADSSRNRLRDGKIEISSIFKWYREDFEKGWRGAANLGQFLALYYHALGLDHGLRDDLAGGRITINFLEYDWRLNKTKE